MLLLKMRIREIHVMSQDTDSTASTKVDTPTDKKMVPFKMKFSHSAVEPTYDITPTYTFQTHKDIRQVPITQLPRWHIEPLMFSVSFLFWNFFFLLATIVL